MSNPSGICLCGCGQATKHSDRTDPARGLVKGEPYDYVRGHSQRRPDFAGELPYCACGCGKRVKLAKWTKDGYVKGQPMTFLQGHYPRTQALMTDPARYTVEDRGYVTVCWITIAVKDKDGYGVMGGGKRSLVGTERTHRRSFKQNIGPIPDGMHVHHLCEQKACVRPDHLELRNPTQHMRDHSSLTIEMVRAIRSSTKTQEALAEEYGVTRSHIGYIKRHRVWLDAGS